MKNLLIYPLLFLLLGGMAPTCARAAPAQRPPFRRWGEETLALTSKRLWLPDRALYAEASAADRAAPAGPAFAWGAGVQLSALAAAARLDRRRYVGSLRAYADALQGYWTEHAGIGGYDVLPGPKPADRYYDDNVWLVLALAETFELTGDRKYRDRAEEAFRFVLSGEDDRLGGGIYWRENKRDSKNTCSNAPAIVAALRLHQLTRKREYLETARRLYAWTCARLQDEDGLFWDNVKLDGKLDRTKFSYNSALMIRANCLFYALTGERKYLEEAQRIARAAEAKWVVRETGALADGGRFAHLLLESFLALNQQDRDRRWLGIAGRALVFLHEKVRDPNGLYPDRWDRPVMAPLQKFTLIDQASAARAYLSMAGAVQKRRGGP